MQRRTRASQRAPASERCGPRSLAVNVSVGPQGRWASQEVQCLCARSGTGLVCSEHAQQPHLLKAAPPAPRRKALRRIPNHMAPVSQPASRAESGQPTGAVARSRVVCTSGADMMYHERCPPRAAVHPSSLPERRTKALVISRFASPTGRKTVGGMRACGSAPSACHSAIGPPSCNLRMRRTAGSSSAVLLSNI